MFLSNSLQNYFACSVPYQGVGRVETGKAYMPFQQKYFAAIKRRGFNQNPKDLVVLLEVLHMSIFFLILNDLIIPVSFVVLRVALRWLRDTECLPNFFFFF